MAAFWPIGTAQIIRIVSYPIRKKSRFWLFCMWSVKEMYHALLPKTDYRDKGRGHDRRLVKCMRGISKYDIDLVKATSKTRCMVVFFGKMKLSYYGFFVPLKHRRNSHHSVHVLKKLNSHHSVHNKRMIQH